MHRPNWIALAAVVGLTTGCGRPATEADCDEIVERIARLELERRKLSAEAVADEIATAKQSLRETSMKECVGKRLTDESMACVRAAQSSREIIEDCFD